MLDTNSGQLLCANMYVQAVSIMKMSVALTIYNLVVIFIIVKVTKKMKIGQ